MIIIDFHIITVNKNIYHIYTSSSSSIFSPYINTVRTDVIGNYPESCMIEGCNLYSFNDRHHHHQQQELSNEELSSVEKQDNVVGGYGGWKILLPRSRLGPDTIHTFDINDTVNIVRLMITYVMMVVMNAMMMIKMMMMMMIVDDNDVVVIDDDDGG